MSEKIGKVKRLGLTPRMLVFSIAWCVFNTVFFGAVLSIKNSQAYVPEFLLLMVEAFLMSVVSSKLQFTAQEWAVFFSISMSGLLSSMGWGTGYFRGNHAGMENAFLRSYHRLYANWYEFWNTYKISNGYWFVSDPTAIQGFLYGGPVPWGLYAPVIAWNIVSFASIYLAYHFLSIVLRKPWIEQEKLTFPWQKPLFEVVKATHNLEGPLVTGKSFWNPVKNKWFWLGFLLAGLLALPDLSELYFGVNWFTGMTIGGVVMGRHRYQRFMFPIDQYISPYWQQNFITGFEFQSWQLAAYILAPMDLLYSAAIFRILSGIIFGDINYYSGSSTFPGGVNTGLIKWQWLYWGSAGVGAMFIAIPLILIWRMRKHIVHTFRAAISGAPTDEDEPHSWRIVWLGFFGFFAVWWATMIIAGIAWWYGITFGVFMTLYFIFQARWICEFGGGGVFTVGYQGMQYYYFSTYLPTVATGTYGNTPEFLLPSMYEWDAFEKWIHMEPPMSPSLVGFKFGKELNVKSREISYAMIIATVIGFIVAVPTAIWMNYNWGYSILANRISFDFAGIAKGQPLSALARSGKSFEAYNGYPPDWWAWLAGGVVMTFAIEYLRSIWPWFFLNPLGIAVSNMWSTLMLLAIAIKWLALRYLGGKGYERVIVSICCGIIIGYGFLWMFGVISTLAWGL